MRSLGGAGGESTPRSQRVATPSRKEATVAEVSEISRVDLRAHQATARVAARAEQVVANLMGDGSTEHEAQPLIADGQWLGFVSGRQQPQW